MARDPIYTAHAHVVGGRANGHGATSDGALEVDLRRPKEMGGEGDGTNPEQLFAVGYAACFEGALGAVARVAALRRRADPVVVVPGHSCSTSAPLAVRCTSTLPRVALEYGHTPWAASTSATACSVSVTEGSVTASSTASLKRRSSIGMRLTLESIATSSTSSFSRRATAPRAPSKHAA